MSRDRRNPRRFGGWGLFLLAVVGALVFMIPFAWTVSTALKPRQQVFASPPQWIPRTFRIEEQGQRVAVNVVTRIDSPAAVVQLLSGPRAGSPPLPVSRSLLGEAKRDGATVSTVRLPAAPEPFEARILRSEDEGIAQVRLPDGTDRFVKPSELIAVFDPQWGNFVPLDNSEKARKEAAWTALPYPFHRFVLNTYTITVINIVGQTLSCSLVAYGFARFRFRGRNVLFLLLLSTLMLPAQVTMIPVFLIWRGAGLIDTFGPLTIPAFFAQNAFFVFLLRQFFMGIPRELDEAAMIDGAGPIRIWWQILMPLCRPAVITVAVLSFIAHWDDFMGPLIYLNSLENYTVSIALRLFQELNQTDFNLLMAAALIHIVPVVILFFIAQRYFVKGIAMTGLKG